MRAAEQRLESGQAMCALRARSENGENCVLFRFGVRSARTGGKETVEQRGGLWQALCQSFLGVWPAMVPPARLLGDLARRPPRRT